MYIFLKKRDLKWSRKLFQKYFKCNKGIAYVTFEALQSKRFWVHIVIEGEKLNTPKLVDAFINDYTKGLGFTKQ